jgi:hypothetical protein
MDVARPSRPPGFDMTYRPAETVFPPPWSVRLPSFLYLLLAAGVIAVVVAGHVSPTNTNLHIWIVERDPTRLIGSRTFATLIALSALAAVMRAGMRGVRVRPDGLQYRDVLTFGWPRVRHYRWAQIDCIVLDQPKKIAIDLWDGSRAFLPDVSDPSALSATLEKVAAARAIPVRGGRGLDEIPDSSEFAEEDA